MDTGAVAGIQRGTGAIGGIQIDT